MILFNAVMNVATLAGIAGLGVWAWRRSRADRANHRAIVREIGRLRMAERNSAELGAALREIRTRLSEQATVNYLAGVRARATERPPLRAVD